MNSLICPRCALELNTHVLDRHIGKSRCQSRQLAARLRERGLHPVTFAWQAKSDHAATALRMFGHDVEIHHTRGSHDNSHITGSASQAWTSLDGVTLALIIEEVARLLAVSYPEAARRLHAHKELIGPFAVAWKLGSKLNDNDLRETLQPIDYTLGSDGKKRRRARYA